MPGIMQNSEKTMPNKFKITCTLESLGGSVGWASDLGSGHDLRVRGFKPCTELCADSSEPGPPSDSVSPSLSAPPPLVLCFPLSLKNE